MSAKRRLASALLVASAGLIASGCASGSASTAQTSGEIRSLSVGLTFTESSVDPAQDIGGGSLFGAFEGLYQYGSSSQMEPDLAVSESHPSPAVYVYHLRHGVRFWDGGAMTSADVVNSLRWKLSRRTVRPPTWRA